MPERFTIVLCANPDCDWVGPLNDVIVWPQGPDYLHCPVCQEAVDFVDEEALRELPP